MLSENKTTTVTLSVDTSPSVSQLSIFLNNMNRLYYGVVHLYASTIALYVTKHRDEYEKIRNDSNFSPYFLFIERYQYFLFAEKALATDKPESVDIFIKGIRNRSLIEDLQVSKISINSPGWIELLGEWNPLKQIRLCIKDLLENRIKSREITIKESEAFMKRNDELIDLMRKAGFDEVEIREVIRQRISIPLNRLKQSSDFLVSIE